MSFVNNKSIFLIKLDILLETFFSYRIPCSVLRMVRHVIRPPLTCPAPHAVGAV